MKFAPALVVAAAPGPCLRQHEWGEHTGDKCPHDNGGPGDGVDIQGSDIECVVSTSGPRAMVCGIGHKSLLPKSFAFTVADKGAAIFVATGSQEVIARDLNPAIPGPEFANALHKPTTYRLSKHEHVIVGGTHLACGAYRSTTKALRRSAAANMTPPRPPPVITSPAPMR